MAKISPIRFIRVTGCILAGRRNGKLESRRDSWSQAYPAEVIAQILNFLPLGVEFFQCAKKILISSNYADFFLTRQRLVELFQQLLLQAQGCVARPKQGCHAELKA
jgi:hypothetical protein